MGPSGAGKTTFCDLALGIRRPQRGLVEFEPSNANVAFIPQKGVVFDELSVRDNISCLRYSKTLGETFRDDKVQNAIESLGLRQVMQNDTPSSALSGGEAQRVMLARIQTVRCDVLILDEPCSFLDNRVKNYFLAALRATTDEYSLLALMVTHVWDEARLVADDVLFFHQCDGKPTTLHYLSVENALRQPPTVDALFGIHWPGCEVLDITKVLPHNVAFAHRVPQGTKFIGFFRDTAGVCGVADWKTELWKAARCSIHVDVSLRKATSTLGETDRIACIFYDPDGLALPSQEL